MTENLAKELLPCPFCGGPPTIERMGSPRVSMIISCENCGASLESGEEFIHAGMAWNRRAALDCSTDAGLEELANKLDVIALKMTRLKTFTTEEIGVVSEHAALLRQPAPVRVSEAMEDYVTHHGDWVKACTIARGAAASQDDRDYWQHQINTLAKLAAAGVRGKEKE